MKMFPSRLLSHLILQNTSTIKLDFTGCLKKRLPSFGFALKAPTHNAELAFMWVLDKLDVTDSTTLLQNASICFYVQRFSEKQ